MNFLLGFLSNETKNFDTLAVIVGSYMADVLLQAALKGTSKSGNKKHGDGCLRRYGYRYNGAFKNIVLYP